MLMTKLKPFYRRRMLAGKLKFILNTASKTGVRSKVGGWRYAYPPYILWFYGFL
ncbi:MAG: hypothetical protein ACK4NN_14250 [Rheinheimera sp.]